MFDITPGMAQAWRDLPRPRATQADIAALESALGVQLPRGYVDFVSQHGFVAFGRDPEGRCMFRYTGEDHGRRETRQGDIPFLFQPERLLQIHRYMTSTELPDDETRPMIPPGYLPVASDAGHGCILLDVAAHPGQVWSWRDSPARRGADDNVAIGFVADDFAAFINHLSSDRP